MLGSKKFRFGERFASKETEQNRVPLLTEEDETNLEAFHSTLQEAIRLLKDEVAAIKAGQLGIVSEIYEQKARILKWLELKIPLIEPFMPQDGTPNRNIPASLEELKKVAAEDSELLSRMSVAARTIVREIEKVNNRNGLSGVYGKRGQKILGSTNPNMRLDREL